MAFADNNEYPVTLRYPLKAPVASNEDFIGDDATGSTGATDYLRIQRKRTKYKFGSSGGGRTGAFYGSNSGFITNTATAEKSFHRSSCYIAIPPGINAQYQPVYRQVNLGVGGAAALKALGSDSFETLAGSLQQAAAAILPEFAASAVAQGANAISGFFGTQGQLDANSLQGLLTGKVFNPYTEQLFQQMNFRNHSFAIKMLARNFKEAKMINDIIQYVKVGAHPVVSGSGGTVFGNAGTFSSKTQKQNKSNGDGTEDVTLNPLQKNANKEFKDVLGDIDNLSNRFFELPDHYKLDYVRINPDANEFNDDDVPATRLHYKMTDTVCSGVSVNYTPDNQYTSFKSYTGDMIQVPAIVLNLQFTEVKLLNQGDVRVGY